MMSAKELRMSAAEQKIARLAAFLYNSNSAPGRQAFETLPYAAQRQWVELAREAVAVLAAEQ